MHTTELPRGWRAHHNGDYSGDVEMTDPAYGTSFLIPFDVMVELVAEAVRTSAISTLEDATVAELVPGLDPAFLRGGPDADAARQGEARVEHAGQTLCAYCQATAVARGVCQDCGYDIGNVNGRRCVELVVAYASHPRIRCGGESLGTSQHCADHQRKHEAVIAEGDDRLDDCTVCGEPVVYPIHTNRGASVS